MAADLNHHHRVTLDKIFRHPLSGNLEWRQVLSLLEAVGTTTQEPNGKVKVELGGETEVLRPPDGKEVDRQLLVDLRRMLTNAGLDQASEATRHRYRGAAKRGRYTALPSFVLQSVRRQAATGLSRWPVADANAGEANDACSRLVEGTYRGGPMDFSAKLDDLQQRAADAKAAAQAAVSESRGQLRQRIDQAKVDVNLAAMDARQQVRWSPGAGRCLCTVRRADHRCCADRGGQWLPLQAASCHGEHA